MKVARFFALLVLAMVGCDNPEAPAQKPAPSALASASAPASAPAPPPAPPTPSAPSASAEPPPSAPTKDAVVSVFDPVKEPARTVKALAGGTVALYLPEWAGTSWKVTQSDKALGKPKEETIPGFAGPTTPAHAFTWSVKDALKGQSHKVTLSNVTKGASFTLGIDVS